MNREILFKAKRSDNGEWVEGFYVCCRRHYYILPIFNDYDPSYGFDDRYDEWVEIDISTLCRYTGLTDKNGKRIWENDIVETNDGETIINIVKFEEGGFMLKGIAETINSVYFDEYDTEEVEVIGNAFDNPELLGDERKDG